MKTKKVVNKSTSFKKTTKKKQNAGGLRDRFFGMFKKTPTPTIVRELSNVQMNTQIEKIKSIKENKKNLVKLLESEINLRIIVKNLYNELTSKQDDKIIGPRLITDINKFNAKIENIDEKIKNLDTKIKNLNNMSIEKNEELSALDKYILNLNKRYDAISKNGYKLKSFDLFNKVAYRQGSQYYPTPMQNTPEPESDQAFYNNADDLEQKRQELLRKKEELAKKREESLKQKKDNVARTHKKKEFVKFNTKQFIKEKETKAKLNKLKEKYAPFLEKLPELRFNIKELQNKLTIDNITTFNIINEDLEKLINSIKEYYIKTFIPTPPSNRNSNQKLYFTLPIIDDKENLNNDFMTDLNDAFNLIKIDMNTSKINRTNVTTKTLEYDVTIFIKNIQFIIFSYTFMKYAEQVKYKLDLIKNPGSNLVWIGDN
jgi:hypothetical protein